MGTQIRSRVRWALVVTAAVPLGVVPIAGRDMRSPSREVEEDAASAATLLSGIMNPGDGVHAEEEY